MRHYFCQDTTSKFKKLRSIRLFRFNLTGKSFRFAAEMLASSHFKFLYDRISFKIATLKVDQKVYLGD